MKDQHEKISGYRDLSQAEIDLMNELKDLEARAGGVLTKVAGFLNAGQPDVDAARWLSLGRTNLETGFMFAIKAIARPTNGLGRNR